MRLPETTAGQPLLGLTSAEAAGQQALDGPNELAAAAPRSLLAQAWAVINQPMLLLLVVAGAINFLIAEPLDGIMLMTFVVVVIGISIYQEHKTENAIAALRDLSAPRALVIRDGVQQRIAGREVVRGDVVLLAEGDRVPADGTLIESASLLADESTLTGESVAVRKLANRLALADPIGRPGGDDMPSVYSGTLVVKGRGIFIVRHTGGDTALGRIGKELAAIEPEPTRLEHEVNRLVRVFAVFGVAAAAGVVLIHTWTRGDFVGGLLAGIATAMAMLPEEFPVVLTVFMALGAWRMSANHVLARRAMVIEAMGSATVVCVDKTGTLTMNSMTVTELTMDGERFRINSEPLPDRFEQLVAAAYLASPVDPFDPMDIAFRELGKRYLTPADPALGELQLIREYPLSEKLLAVVHVWADPAGNRQLIAAKGAPEAVMQLCQLDPPQRAAVIQQVEHSTAGGLRVLAVASLEQSADSELPADQRQLRFEFRGLVGLADPIRPGVADAVRDCATAGVRTVMITGDYPGTALAIADAAGIDRAAGCITGPQLEDLSDAELAERIRTVNVFARMVPEQKLRLVRALQANDEVVAMTGDGVNDAPALRAADIGIAMGARGTDVAREAAALVITDDNFTSIAAGIRQGRGIFANLRKAMGYVVAVHVPIVGMSLIPVFTRDLPLVMLPLQIAFLELVIDPACSVVFEMEQVDPETMQQPPRRVGEPVLGRDQLTRAVAQGGSLLLSVVAVYAWAVSSGLADASVRSLTFAALVFGNLSLILVNRSRRLTVWESFRQRRNPAAGWIVVIALAMLSLLLSLRSLGDAFNLGSVTVLQVLGAGLAAILSQSWVELAKLRRRG